MSETIPELIQPLLSQYLSALNRQLPEFVEACYLHGSIALGAFLPNQSDIDFITVISRPCTAHDIRELTHIHHAIAQDFPQWPLQGSYLQWHDLGKVTAEIEPGPVYTDNQLHSHAHHDINAVTWWLLKNRSLALMRPAPETLGFQVNWDFLETEMLDNLNSYWRRFVREPRRMLWLFSDYGIQWTVLGVLRQFYTFQTRDITSKTGAGEYALRHLPAYWQRLVQEALNIRNETSPSLYRSPILRAFEAFQFLKFMIRTCNQQFAVYTSANQN